MEFAGRIVSYDSESQLLVQKIREPLNIKRIETYYHTDLSRVLVHNEVEDPRKFSKAQRRLYWAMLNDIELSYGQPRESLDEYFKNTFFNKYFRKVSVADDSINSVEEVTNLINLVIDFVLLSRNIEFSESFKYLGNSNYWFYSCLMNSMCCLCGDKGEKAHVQAVGIGRSRKTIDHTLHQFMSLCRTHHGEQHTIGLTEFLEKHIVIPTWLTRKDLKKLNISVIEIEEEKNE